MDWHGIDCRLGQPHFLSETHYDFKRNFIAMLSGHKRYFLFPPNECEQLALLPYGHPSARHSKVRLTGHNTTAWNAQPDSTASEREAYLSAGVLDVHLQEGDVLHLPAYWFHAVLSLSRTVQCNTFMGAPNKAEAGSHVERCMMRLSDEE